jgi:hypothetical protein
VTSNHAWNWFHRDLRAAVPFAFESAELVAASIDRSSA